MSGTRERDEAEPVDYRFTLANERTFLAWIRTSLGLLAGSIAVETLVTPTPGVAMYMAIAVGMVLALILPIAAYRRWRSVERAMEAGRRLPDARVVPVVAGGVSIAVVAAAVSLLLS